MDFWSVIQSRPSFHLCWSINFEADLFNATSPFRYEACELVIGMTFATVPEGFETKANQIEL